MLDNPKSYKDLDEVKNETVDITRRFIHGDSNYTYKPMIVEEGLLVPFVYYSGFDNKISYLLIEKSIIKEAINLVKDLDDGR